jgi:hypothetical protein
MGRAKRPFTIFSPLAVSEVRSFTRFSWGKPIIQCVKGEIKVSIFRNLFSKKQPESKGERSEPLRRGKPAEDKCPSERKSLLTAVSKADVSSRTCGICGAHYDHPNRKMPLLVIDVKDWELDLGGYCPSCKLYLCSKHVQLVPCGTINVFGTVHDTYACKCITCQTTLTDQEGDDPDATPPSIFMGDIRIS